jgi:hypothetical protein
MSTIKTKELTSYKRTKTRFVHWIYIVDYIECTNYQVSLSETMHSFSNKFYLLLFSLTKRQDEWEIEREVV